MDPIAPTTPIRVTLQAQEWNQVVFWLGKQAYEAVAPLIARITDQAQAAAQSQPPLMNGEANHVSD